MQKGHRIILEKLLQVCKDQEIVRILDAGSGGTSLKEIRTVFPDSQIDAVVYPGDERKLKSIEPYLTEQVRVWERDICETSFEESYDLVVAHLLLGEASIRDFCVKNSYEMIEQRMEKCSEPQKWEDFTGYHNFGYLIKKSIQ